MSHYTSLNKPHRAIWCEIYVIREGYIPYLKKWTELQESSNIKVKDDSQEDEAHSNIQRLFPGGPKKVSDSLIQMTQNDCQRREISYSQAHSQILDESWSRSYNIEERQEWFQHSINVLPNFVSGYLALRLGSELRELNFFHGLLRL